MKFYLLLFTLFIGSQQSLVAQSSKEKVISPILLDKSTLSGVGLKKIDLKDEPEKDFYQKMLYRGKDISIFVVSTETWKSEFRNFWFDEFIYMYHGEAIVKPEVGAAQLLHSGDYFFAAKGFTGDWNINAGDNLHYELSVITTSRADSTLISENLSHQVFDRSTLSGSDIQLDNADRYSEILREGVELTVKLHAERPSQQEIITPAREQLVRVLSGEISIVDGEGTKQTFYSEDFFVIPDGFTGQWASDGHSIVKYLTIEKT